MPGESIRVLVVDDNQDMLDIYRAMFRDEPRYQVDMMSDAMKALRKLGEKTYDVIILDIIMEPLGGESFFVYLRSDERTMHIPVIAVTVLEPEMLETINRIDSASVLQKPVHKDELFEAIENSLS